MRKSKQVRKIRSVTGVASMHPARPTGTDGVWRVSCEGDSCGKVFYTYSRNRRYCSNTCKHKSMQRNRRFLRAAIAFTYRECGYEKCGIKFLPSRGNHYYCSDKCRVYGARDMLDLSNGKCRVCETSLRDKRRGALYCSDKCRKRYVRDKATQTTFCVRQNDINDTGDIIATSDKSRRHSLKNKATYDATQTAGDSVATSDIGDRRHEKKGTLNVDNG